MKSMIENDFLFCAGGKMAAILGVNEALVLGQINYWICKNKENKVNYKDGRYWTFNSIKKWHEDFFYFWSERTVKRIFKSLEKKGLLIVGNFNKLGFDRTKWYSIDYDKFNEIVVANKDFLDKHGFKRSEGSEEISHSICDNAINQNEQMHSDRLAFCNLTDCHNEKGQNYTDNTNNNKNNTSAFKQHKGKMVVVIETRGILKEFLECEYKDYYTEKVINILESKGKDCNYLRNKVELTKSKNENNKFDFLIAALQFDL